MVTNLTFTLSPEGRLFKIVDCAKLMMKLNHHVLWEMAMKIIGVGICFAIILGAILQVGHHLFIDINAALFVLGGASGFLVFKKDAGNHIKNFGQGAVYFGWLGTLIGLIAITGNRFMVWGDVEKMGPALAVAMLTIFYGYTIKMVTIALTED